MNSFEWNVLLFLGMLLTFAFYNHIRTIRIMDDVACMHDQVHQMTDLIFSHSCEHEEDAELENNIQEIQEWDNA